MKHRISAGCFVVHEQRILLVHHLRPGVHDFWVCPGGGVEGDEPLAAAAEREVFEETGLVVHAHTLAYIGDLIDSGGRVIKFWYLADLVSGQINIFQNPARQEAIVEAKWFSATDLPKGHVFPPQLRGRFWSDVEAGFEHPILLPLEKSVV